MAVVYDEKVGKHKKRKLSLGEKIELIGTLIFNTRAAASVEDERLEILLGPFEERLARWARRFWRLMKVMAIFLSLIGAVVFGLFITEEAIQRAGWACYRWADLGEWKELNQCADRIRAMALALETFNDFLGWISPFTHGAYTMFVEATLMEVKSYKALARKLMYGCYKDWQTRRWICPEE